MGETPGRRYLYDFNILEVGALGTSVLPAVDQMVKKRGRTTLLTWGKVVDDDYWEWVAGKLYVEQI